MKFSLKDAIIIFCLSWLLSISAWYFSLPNQIPGYYVTFWLNWLNPFLNLHHIGIHPYFSLYFLFFSLTPVASLYLTHKKLLEERYSPHQTFRVSLLVAFLIFTLPLIIYFFALLYFYSGSAGNALMGFAFLAVIGVGAAPLISGCGFLLPSILYALAYRTFQGRINPIKVVELFLLGVILLFVVLNIANAFTCRFNQDAECLSSKAGKLNDPSICHRAKKGNIITLCLYNFYNTKAARGEMFIEDPCKELKGYSTSDYGRCVSDIAKLTKNVALCDLIKSESNKYEKGSASFCYKDLAVELKDPALCEKIAAFGDDKSYPLNFCYDELARLTRNGNLCKKINLFDDHEIDRYNHCLEQLAILTNDKGLCEDLRPTTPGSWDKDGRANSSGSKEACLRAIPSP